MENNKTYFEEIGAEFTLNTIDETTLSEIEREENLEFGTELKQYIFKYGYLAYKHIELFGINSKQVKDSDMIKQTIYLHKFYPKTASYIALANLGEGRYALVDNNDMVYDYDSELDEMVGTETKVFGFIKDLFASINNS